MTRTCPRITETITYKRRKQVGRKQDILDSLPGEEVHRRLDDLTCPDCQHELKEIADYTFNMQLLTKEARKTGVQINGHLLSRDFKQLLLVENEQ